MHGNGTFIYADGKKYIGEWEQNQMHGEGTFYWPNGTAEFQGEFNKGKYHGKGKLIKNDYV